MRLLVILPAEERLVRVEEVEARRRQLALRASPDTELELGFVDHHSVWQESPSRRDFEILAPYVAKRAREAGEQGFHGVMVHCTADPGLREARGVCSIPVVGPAQAELGVPILDGVGNTLGLTEMLAQLHLRSRAASASPVTGTPLAT